MGPRPDQSCLFFGNLKFGAGGKRVALLNLSGCAPERRPIGDCCLLLKAHGFLLFFASLKQIKLYIDVC